MDANAKYLHVIAIKIETGFLQIDSGERFAKRYLLDPCLPNGFVFSKFVSCCRIPAASTWLFLFRLIFWSGCKFFSFGWIPWSHVLGCPPFPLVVTIVVTSKVSTFLVGDFNKPSKSSARICFEKNDHTPPYHFDSLFIWKKLCICMICSKREAYMMRFTKNNITRLHGLRDMKHDTFYHFFGLGDISNHPCFHVRRNAFQRWFSESISADVYRRFSGPRGVGVGHRVCAEGRRLKIWFLLGGWVDGGFCGCNKCDFRSLELEEIGKRTIEWIAGYSNGPPNLTVVSGVIPNYFQWEPRLSMIYWGYIISHLQFAWWIEISKKNQRFQYCWRNPANHFEETPEVFFFEWFHISQLVSPISCVNSKVLGFVPWKFPMNSLTLNLCTTGHHGKAS